MSTPMTEAGTRGGAGAGSAPAPGPGGVPTPRRLAPSDLLGLGLLGPRTRKLRSALCALGIALGIAALIAVTGVSASSQAHLLSRLDQLGSNMLTAAPGKDLTGNVVALPKEAAAMLGRIGPVSQVTAVTGTKANVYRTDLVPAGQNGSLKVFGAQPNLLDTLHGELAAGRWFDAGAGELPLTVLGHDAAQVLGIDRPGGRVWIGGHWYGVIGILRADELAPEIDNSALVSWEQATGRLGSDGTAANVYLRADPDQLAAVERVIGPTANPAAPSQVTVSRPADLAKARSAAKNGMNGLILALAGVSLLVGGVGIANTMVVGVMERRGEVGLRRALGARRGQIAAQFLIEAVLLGLLGGLAGAAFGALGALGYATAQGWPAVIPWTMATAGPALAVVIGAAAGLYPALRAARLPPTTALRGE
ncbi:ABC transporter permease [Kitasatospora sp. NPDC059327]|uniref:ABC transporter permease n=1 Tax=Kitasatospora sp. NPDC059327 TaxID=3346803 RepID=UPI00368F3849